MINRRFRTCSGCAYIDEVLILHPNGEDYYCLKCYVKLRKELAKRLRAKERAEKKAAAAARKATNQNNRGLFRLFGGKK